MTQETRFPFRLEHAFFRTLEFHREPSVPPQLNVDFSVQIKVHSEQFPDRLEIDLKVETQEEQPLTFCLELIGIFTLVEGEPKPDREILPKFVNERALHVLWPYLTQVISQATVQMGINPLKIPIPYFFAFEPENG